MAKFWKNCSTEYVISICYCKICSSRNHAYKSVQIREISSLIYLHDFSWLDALLLKAEFFIVDTRPSDLLHINFSMSVHE